MQIQHSNTALQQNDLWSVRQNTRLLSKQQWEKLQDKQARKVCDILRRYCPQAGIEDPIWKNSRVTTQEGNEMKGSSG